jgi:hypothetical protein
MKPTNRFGKLKQSAIKGTKVATIIASVGFLSGATPLRVVALGAAIVLFFTLPSIVIFLSDLYAEPLTMDSDEAGVEVRSTKPNLAYLLSIPKGILFALGTVLCLLAIFSAGGNFFKFFIFGASAIALGCMIKARNGPTGLVAVISFATTVGGCFWLAGEIGKNFR